MAFIRAMPSTAIRSLSYDEATTTMFVTFVDGDLYAYFEVPPAVYEAFRTARSKGRFFAFEIRGRYRYSRVEDPDDPELSPAPGPGDPASPPPAAAGRSA